MNGDEWTDDLRNFWIIERKKRTKEIIDKIVNICFLGDQLLSVFLPPRLLSAVSCFYTHLIEIAFSVIGHKTHLTFRLLILHQSMGSLIHLTEHMVAAFCASSVWWCIAMIYLRILITVKFMHFSVHICCCTLGLQRAVARQYVSSLSEMFPSCYFTTVDRDVRSFAETYWLIDWVIEWNDCHNLSYFMTSCLADFGCDRQL